MYICTHGPADVSEETTERPPAVLSDGGGTASHPAYALSNTARCGDVVPSNGDHHPFIQTGETMAIFSCI